MSRSLALEPRPGLRDIAPYRPSPRRPARHRPNTNESAYPPPEGLVERVVRALTAAELNRYPDDSATELRSALAAANGCAPEAVWVANGSNEVLLHLFLAFGGIGRRVLLFAPTYSLHATIPRIAATTVLELSRGRDLLIDPAVARAALRHERPEVVLACSPNNPTGRCEPRATVELLVAEAPGLVVVDEAYIEFAAPESSVRPLLDAHPNLVIVKTLSKAWRLAGVRIGYALANPDVVAELGRVRLPYNLSVVTQAFGRAALDFGAEALAVVKEVAAERARLTSELRGLGVHAHPSDANFVLFEVGDPQRVWDELLERGVLVRSYVDQASLERCLRVTVGTPTANTAFLEALAEVLG